MEDIAKRLASLAAILARHDPLRATFAAEDGVAYQIFAAPDEAPHEHAVIDLTHAADAAEEEELQRQIADLEQRLAARAVAGHHQRTEPAAC